MEGHAGKLVRGAAFAAAASAGLALTSPPATQAASQVPVLRTAADEFNGFAGSGFFGWVQNSLNNRNTYNLFLRDVDGATLRVNRPGTQGFGGGIDGSTVVYQEVTRTASRLVLYDTAAHSYTGMPITASSAAAMHPTISGAWVLYTDGVRHRVTSVRLYNRATGETRRLGSLAGRGRYVYSGQVAGEWAVWGKVLPHAQDVFLTSLTTRKTLRIDRPRGVKFQYDPAVTPTGTVFFERSKPCVSRCPTLNTPVAVNQLVKQPLADGPRVLATLRRGQDGGYMYAAPQGAGIRVLYSLFNWLPRGRTSYQDIFALTVSV